MRQCFTGHNTLENARRIKTLSKMFNKSIEALVGLLRHKKIGLLRHKKIEDISKLIALN